MTRKLSQIAASLRHPALLYILTAWMAVGVGVSSVTAQFQKSIRSRPPAKKDTVYCPTIDFGSAPKTTEHPAHSEAEVIVPPLVPPETIAPRSSVDKRSTQRPPSELDQLHQRKQRSMDEILRQIQAIREQIRTGRVPGNSADSLPSETMANVRPDSGDAVPLPQPGPAETALQIPDEPDSADQTTPIDVSADDPSAATESPVTDPSAMAAADVAAPDAAAPTDDAARRFSDLMNALTKDDVPQTDTSTAAPKQKPGYLSATTVLDSPVDRLKLADNLFATGEIQLALTMYEAVRTKDLSAEDRYWHTYQQASCHRRLGMYGEAESIYRQLAGNSDSGNVSVLSRWWLERLEERKELEAQAAQIRTLIETYKQTQSNESTSSQ
ncbi:MAG: hypothetical protein NXI04_07275 [Planctomycetaceae bacterium]|nr:hypothetical protein [Planctomycetaceae bacterium]